MSALTCQSGECLKCVVLVFLHLRFFIRSWLWQPNGHEFRFTVHGDISRPTLEDFDLRYTTAHFNEAMDENAIDMSRLVEGVKLVSRHYRYTRAVI